MLQLIIPVILIFDVWPKGPVSNQPPNRNSAERWSIPHEFDPLALDENGFCPMDRSVDCSFISVPTPEYPRMTELYGAECIADIKKLASGFVEVVDVNCTDERFVEVTREAFDGVRWIPTNACGQPCSIIGRVVEYPITYRLE